MANTTSNPHADLEGAGLSEPLVAMPQSTFFGAPSCLDLDRFNAQVALLGLPYDQGSLIPYIRTGQAQGPRAVRANPTFLYSGNPFDGPADPAKPSEGFHCVDDGKLYLNGVTMADIGDLVITPGDLKRFVNTATTVARRIAEKQAVLVGVGGDHSITFPLIRGMEPWGKVDMVHFDAHFDIRDEVAGSRYSHSSGISRAAELPFVGNITQLGMRNMATQSSLDQVKKFGTTVVPAKQMHDRGAAACVEAHVPEAEFLYVTIDTDVFDWSIAPGTALPEPGGLTLEQMRECMQVLVRKGRVVGFDITCLNPMVDTAFYGGITTRLTSYTIAYFIGYIFDAQQDTG
ncbi:MAG: arginase family protein [Hyphomicrobiales bacterium]|nr:arginase family protein [Hyphomicrobiales bacterium]